MGQCGGAFGGGINSQSIRKPIGAIDAEGEPGSHRLAGFFYKADWEQKKTILKSSMLLLQTIISPSIVDQNERRQAQKKALEQEIHLRRPGLEPGARACSSA
jgi:hypothetical protein